MKKILEVTCAGSKGGCDLGTGEGGKTCEAWLNKEGTCVHFDSLEISECCDIYRPYSTENFKKRVEKCGGDWNYNRAIFECKDREDECSEVIIKFDDGTECDYANELFKMLKNDEIDMS